ncbi:MAG: Smr/MutS family protein [Termitinemataceae bacterium]|nr:MAG: Smr/MutS family protein [Termitinemataceae bacterium]
MDFGEILDNWEGKHKDVISDKKAGKNFEAMFAEYLDKNPVINKDKDDALGEETPAQRRSRLLAKKCDDQIDLHGKTKQEALAALEIFFEDAFQSGAEKILVIHGKGNHSKENFVLADLCRGFIEKNPYAGEHGKAKAESGGSGATWVILRRK